LEVRHPRGAPALLALLDPLLLLLALAGVFQAAGADPLADLPQLAAVQPYAVLAAAIRDDAGFLPVRPPVHQLAAVRAGNVLPRLHRAGQFFFDQHVEPQQVGLGWGFPNCVDEGLELAGIEEDAVTRPAPIYH